MFENPRYVARAIDDADAVDIQQLVWAFVGCACEKQEREGLFAGI